MTALSLRTTYDLTVFRKVADGQLYAFPVGAPGPWGGVSYPLQSEYVREDEIAKGALVHSVVPLSRDRVQCTIGDRLVITPRWVIAEDTAP